MALRVWLLWIVLLLAGCGGKTPDPSTVVVVPGLGISNVADITMSLNGIRKEVGDLEIESDPKAGFPWQKDILGERRRLPWEKPLYYLGVSSSLGLTVSATNRNIAVQEMNFWCGPDGMAGANAVFTGRISGGLSFANGRKVTRSEVVAVFGEPSRSEGDSRDALRQVHAGKSVSHKSRTAGNSIEILFYPTNGINFILQNDVVTSFEICPKVQPQQNPTPR